VHCVRRRAPTGAGQRTRSPSDHHSV
jgi:hypothetical protein